MPLRHFPSGVVHEGRSTRSLHLREDLLQQRGSAFFLGTDVRFESQRAPARLPHLGAEHDPAHPAIDQLTRNVAIRESLRPAKFGVAREIRSCPWNTVKSQSAARVLDLLEYLAGCSEPVKLKEIVATLGFSESSAHALANNAGPHAEYAILGTRPRTSMCSVHCGSRASIGHRAPWTSAASCRPAHSDYGKASGRRTGETVMLPWLTARRRLPTHTQSAWGKAGPNRPGSGRLLLAALGLPAAYQRLFFARDPSRGQDSQDAHRSATRSGACSTRSGAEGLAVSDEEALAGSNGGFAAPIWGERGKVIAALNLGVVALRYPPARRSSPSC
ncbi:hypothetical protein FQR65_LT20593 [Abscondita terminalis]|nr:hypothetical protein FQR65_LT20593 [Abscondita terminalis]